MNKTDINVRVTESRNRRFRFPDFMTFGTLRW